MERVDMSKGKGRKGLIFKTWERCRSFGAKKRSSGVPSAPMSKCRSWPRGFITSDNDKPSAKRRIAPEGCFFVYVGPEKERFVIKTEHANHPLFKMLLEEAEMEYGYSSQGPLALPCEVDLFHKVLWEMGSEDDDGVSQGCNFGYSPYRLLSPSRMAVLNQI